MIIYRKLTDPNNSPGEFSLWEYDTIDNCERCIYDTEHIIDNDWGIYITPDYDMIERRISKEEAFLEIL